MVAFWRQGVAAAVAGWLVCAGSMPAVASEAITNIDAAEAGQLVAAGMPLIDVRRADEWQATGVVAHSHLITAFNSEPVDAGLSRPHQGRGQAGEPVVIICRSGNRSSQVARLLTEQAGFTHVYNVAGGIIQWARNGQPLQPCANC
ncbi:rhodanese-like domain-containing protein [Defluviicoccus vanus]|nr:rhodanese-like domain-containing protein [Defluviicoccus vanus]